MARFSTLKDHFLESRLFMGRALVMLAFCALLVGVLVIRLVYLQVIAHEHFTTLADGNRVRILPEPPNRGLIYDRSGVLLAENLPSYRLEITPEQVKDMEASLEALGELIQLREVDLERFARLRKSSPVFRAIPLRFRLSEEEVARFAVNRHRFPGIDIEAGLTRHYPLGPLAVHALGYVGRIDERDLQTISESEYSGTSHIGKTGLERTYEEQLHGSVGHRQVETNAQGRVLRVLERSAPVPGSNLYLTLDAQLQAAIERIFDGRTGAAVAIDPDSGDVLALASMPVFDPNPFVNGIEVADYRALQEDPARPLFNRALRGQYPPGSTIKPFVGLGGLEQGITTSHASTYCPGFYKLPGRERHYRDWKRSGHGTTDLHEAIVQSCDVYFYDLALTMGIDRLHEALAHFGLGRTTGIDLIGELGGLLPSREWKRAARNEGWFPGETLITGIGQGFMLATPLQLANATAILANGGRKLQPRLVRTIQASGAQEPEAVPVLELDHVPRVNSRHWQDVINAMIDTIHGPRGTARSIANAPYRIAGKTGTAQVFGLKEEEEYDAESLEYYLRDHALFIAFAPADKPRIALAVIVEHGGSGGGVAAPVARRILDAYLLDEPT
ncbi:MAG: penicillin-binding protein 2 [Gammaproteobacteria bacterium]|nr:penicillin-binding protein 2 [Gammaproteobacteria bacterium]